MASNYDLDWLEQRIMLALKGYPGSTTADILEWFLEASPAEVNQALSNLISKSLVVGSHDQPIKYSVVGGSL